MTIEQAILVFGAIAAVLGAVGGLGGLAALLTLRSTRSRTRAEAGRADANAAATLVSGASELIEDLRAELEFTRQRVDELQEQLQNSAQERATLQETLDHAIARLTTLEAQDQAQRGQIELLRQRLAEMEAENKRLLADNRAIVGELSQRVRENP